MGTSVKCMRLHWGFRSLGLVFFRVEVCELLLLFLIQSWGRISMSSDSWHLSSAEEEKVLDGT